MAERLVSARQISDVLRRANGHRSTTRLAELVGDAAVPTRSGHEDLVLDLILDAGLARPDINRRLAVGRRMYEPDMRWAAQRLILEIDSSWHNGRLAKEIDAERQADLEASGERVLRTTLEQAKLHPDQLLARLVAAGAPYTDPRR